MLPCPTPLWGPGAVPGKWADVCGFLKRPCSDGHWKVRQHELPSWGMAPLGLWWMAQRTITSRKTRPMDPFDRTFCAVPIRQIDVTHQRCYGWQVAFFVHVRFSATNNVRVSSPSDLMTFPFLIRLSLVFHLIRQSHVFHSTLVVNHPFCMHDHLNTACYQKENIIITARNSDATDLQ